MGNSHDYLYIVAMGISKDQKSAVGFALTKIIRWEVRKAYDNKYDTVPFNYFLPRLSILTSN